MKLRIPTPTYDGAWLVCSECGCAWRAILDGESNWMEDGCGYSGEQPCLCHDDEWTTLTWEKQPRAVA